MQTFGIGLSKTSKTTMRSWILFGVQRKFGVQAVRGPMEGNYIIRRAAGEPAYENDDLFKALHHKFGLAW